MVYSPEISPIFRKMRWAADMIRFPDEIFEELWCFREMAEKPVRLRIPLDRGGHDTASAFVSLHYNPYPDDKPYKGGIRLHHDPKRVNAELLRMLSVEMTLKTAIADLPFGGGKSGILVPRPATEYSTSERNRILEAFTEALYRKGIFNLRTYCGATDVGTTEADMDRINYAYWSLDRKSLPLGTTVTGRSFGHGGIPGRREATARGCLIVLGEIIRALRPDLAHRTLTVNVQGLGQVGGNIARIARQIRDVIGLDLLVTGVSNSTGGVYNPSGIDLEALLDTPGDSLTNLDGERCGSDDILVRPCDILIPAAAENVLTEGVAERVQAQVVCEAANAPTTEGADEVLRKRKVLIVPDILANAGGVTVSFEEWRRSLQGPYHEIEYGELLNVANAKLDATMRAATEDLLGYAKRYSVDLRGAAMLKALDKLAEEIGRKRGKGTGSL